MNINTKILLIIFSEVLGSRLWPTIRKSFLNVYVTPFHLGNGALLKRIYLKADLQAKALKELAGIMINDKYDLNDFEKKS